LLIGLPYSFFTRYRSGICSTHVHM